MRTSNCIPTTTDHSLYLGTTGRPKGALGTHRNMTEHHRRRFLGVAQFLAQGRAIPVFANPLDAPQRATLLSVPFFTPPDASPCWGPQW